VTGNALGGKPPNYANQASIIAKSNSGLISSIDNRVFSLRVSCVDEHRFIGNVSGFIGIESKICRMKYPTKYEPEEIEIAV
jgi:hypothetical protein